MPGQIPITIDFKPSGGGSSITSIQGGQSFDATITLDSTVSSDTPVTVSVNNSAVLLPALPMGSTDYTVASGNNSVTLHCTTRTVSSNTVVTFTATANGTSITASITVTP